MKVTVRQGTFRGATSGGVASFKGVPYAAPPVGRLRFAAPEPPLHHEGTADATDWGPTVSNPPQRSPVMDKLLPDPRRPGDAGLNLNIWTSDVTASAPVFVFVHGGGFATGTGSTEAFDGSSLARRGLVVVTINYRLGVEGFLDLPGAEPNRGLLDQIAALEWIRGNIEAFGGDPARVTLGGESAGAMSVLTLMAMPRAEGLFARAIVQSGTAHHVHSPELAKIALTELGAELGVEPTVDALLALPVDEVHAATNALLIRLGSGQDPRFGEFRRLGLQPVIDGEVLPHHPYEAARQGVGVEVDLLIGFNSDEYALFTGPAGLGHAMTEEQLMASTRRVVGGDPESLIATYREHNPDATIADLFVLIQSDWFCRVPTLLYADARAEAGAPTHVYEFAWRSRTFGGLTGACHTIEIPFVFDTLADPWGKELRGDDAPQDLADLMGATWAAFVTTGDPGWRGYGHDRLIQRLDLTPTLVQDPEPYRKAAWAGLI